MTAQERPERPLTPVEARARFLGHIGAEVGYAGNVDSIPVEVEFVQVIGNAAIGHGRLEDGSLVRFVGDRRMMVALGEAIEAAGEPLAADVERWQLI